MTFDVPWKPNGDETCTICGVRFWSKRIWEMDGKVHRTTECWPCLRPTLEAVRMLEKVK